MSSVSYPPSVPPHASYTSCYCEENVYLLLTSFLEAPDFCESWHPSVVFISNHTKTVALWSQRAAREDGCPVVWDYHVLLLLRPVVSAGPDEINDGQSVRTGSFIYDFDSTLDLPCDAQDYLEQTFPYASNPSGLDAEYHRIVPGDVFAADFASDRSHMVVPTPQASVADDTTEVQIPSVSPVVVYHAPPPSYPPISGVRARENAIVHNLMSHFVDMNNPNGFGVVLDLQQLTKSIISRD